MIKATAQIHESCANCGYPLDTHDSCYDVSNGARVIVCSKACGSELLRREEKTSRPLYPPAT